MESPGDEGGGGGGGAGAPSFKLRFSAARALPGRSNVSLVKPLGLPATVAVKFYVRERASDGPEVEAALRRVQALFARGPRDKYRYAPLSSHEYGWWVWAARPDPPVLRHPIRDSPWLKERLRLLPPEPARTR